MAIFSPLLFLQWFNVANGLATGREPDLYISALTMSKRSNLRSGSTWINSGNIGLVKQADIPINSQSLLFSTQPKLEQLLKN